MNINQNFNKFLPIGTICLIKGAIRRVMITGFLPMSIGKKKEIYDYSGCVFPYGIVSSSRNMVFNHDQIDKVLVLGYIDNEVKDLLAKLPEAEVKFRKNSGVKDE